jgi:hypothetical protein
MSETSTWAVNFRHVDQPEIPGPTLKVTALDALHAAATALVQFSGLRSDIKPESKLVVILEKAGEVLETATFAVQDILTHVGSEPVLAMEPGDLDRLKDLALKLGV